MDPFRVQCDTEFILDEGSSDPSQSSTNFPPRVHAEQKNELQIYDDSRTRNQSSKNLTSLGGLGKEFVNLLKKSAQDQEEFYGRRKPLVDLSVGRKNLQEKAEAKKELEKGKAEKNRRLDGALNYSSCPVDELNDVENDASYAGLLDSYVTAGTNYVERMRNKPESYYEDLANNFLMFLCDETDKERCVEENSPLAAKDWSGERCIRAADFECPAGTCERASNCYWNSVFEGQNRTTRFSSNKYDEAAAALYGINDSYARDIAKPGIVGCIVAVVLLLLWIVFFTGRYCCCCLWARYSRLCCLCSPEPKKLGYRCLDIIIPVFLYVLSCVGVIAAGTLAYIGNEDVSVAISNAFSHSNGLMGDLNIFFNRSRAPLQNINSIVEDAALDAATIFNGTTYVTDDAIDIVNSFQGYFQLHSEGLNESNANEQFASASIEFDEKITPITNDVQSMLDTLESDLYENTDTIKSGINGVLDQLETFAQSTVDWQEVLQNYEEQELDTRGLRLAAVLTIFLVSLFFVVIGLFGAIVSRNRTRRCSFFFRMMNVAGFFSAWLGSLSLIMASVMMCLSFVLYDTCQVSNVVTRDFEPFVGDKISPGVNACFNDTNLVEAFNMTEKVNFQNELDEGIQKISNVNVSEEFLFVLEPLSDIQLMVYSLSDNALLMFNEATSSNLIFCPFNDTYTEATILSPWENWDPERNATPYVIRDNFGDPTTYRRVGAEEGDVYLGRIYNKAGICSQSSSCCIQSSTPLLTCESDVYDDCDFGENCEYPCEDLKTGIVEGFRKFVQLRNKELMMTADLGMTCPVGDGISCPTQEFRTRYSNFTLVGLLDDYEQKMIETQDSLVNLASTSVGEAMVEVEDFLCKMNASFVERRYDEVKYDVCGTLFGGVVQINWSLLFLGICLEIVAIMAHILTIRLQDFTDEDAAKFTIVSSDGRNGSRRRVRVY